MRPGEVRFNLKTRFIVKGKGKGKRERVVQKSATKSEVLSHLHNLVHNKDGERATKTRGKDNGKVQMVFSGGGRLRSGD